MPQTHAPPKATRQVTFIDSNNNHGLGGGAKAIGPKFSGGNACGA